MDVYRTGTKIMLRGPIVGQFLGGNIETKAC